MSALWVLPALVGVVGAFVLAIVASRTVDEAGLLRRQLHGLRDLAPVVSEIGASGRALAGTLGSMRRT